MTVVTLEDIDGPQGHDSRIHDFATNLFNTCESLLVFLNSQSSGSHSEQRLPPCPPLARVSASFALLLRGARGSSGGKRTAGDASEEQTRTRSGHRRTRAHKE
eukprot:COSAG06_NODE_3517_length_5235_cov_4.335475_3_plen_103_part_00